MSLKHITEGWFNGFLQSFNLLNEEMQLLGEARMNVCTDCKIRKGFKCSSENTGMDINKKPFRGCGCRIDKKVLCEECECPGGYW